MVWRDKAEMDDLVEVEIDKVVGETNYAYLVRKEGVDSYVGKQQIDNADELKDSKGPTTVLVPRWLARANEWPEGD